MMDAMQALALAAKLRTMVSLTETQRMEIARGMGELASAQGWGCEDVNALRARVAELEAEAADSCAYVEDWRARWDREQVVQEARRLTVACVTGQRDRLRVTNGRLMARVAELEAAHAGLLTRREVIAEWAWSIRRYDGARDELRCYRVIDAEYEGAMLAELALFKRLCDADCAHEVALMDAEREVQ